jgi:hypothetical protein
MNTQILISNCSNDHDCLDEAGTEQNILSSEHVSTFGRIVSSSFKSSNDGLTKRIRYERRLKKIK